MKRSRFFISVMLTAIATVLFVGCAQPPEAEKAAAKAALDAAVSAEASRYASADFLAAMALWDASEAQMEGKRYSAAKQGYIDARAAFEKANAAVPAGKKAVVGDVGIEEVRASLTRLEEDWKTLQGLYLRVEARLEKKRLWENDSTTFLRGLREAKDLIASDHISAKLKIDGLKPFISSYTNIFKQVEATPEKLRDTRKGGRRGPED